MIAIVSRQRSDGSFPDVGTNNRTLWQDLYTISGVIRRARRYAQGKSFRIEFFHDEKFYTAEPFYVYTEAT